MDISGRNRYGLSAIVELAMAYGKGPVPYKAIAKKKDISSKYLEQIISLLMRGGLTVAYRGPNGGQKLARPPAQIRLSDVITSLDGSWTAVECPKHSRLTMGCHDCIVRAVWSNAHKAIWDVLESTTLQDLVDLADGTKKKLD